MPGELSVLVVGNDEEEGRVSGGGDAVRRRERDVSFARTRSTKGEEGNRSLEDLHSSERHELGRLSRAFWLVLSESEFWNEKEERARSASRRSPHRDARGSKFKLTSVESSLAETNRQGHSKFLLVNSLTESEVGTELER